MRQENYMPGLRQEKYRISLESFVAPESKEVFEKQKDGGMSKGHRTQSTPNVQSWNNLRNKKNNIVCG